MGESQNGNYRSGSPSHGDQRTFGNENPKEFKCRIGCSLNAWTYSPTFRTLTFDLPDQVTFNLYDSQTAHTPIGTQTFARGQYTVDFEFSKSDDLTLGARAKFKTQEGRHS